MNNSDEIKMTSAMRYSKHKDQFAKLTKRKKITTDHQIIQLDITNDDKYALVLLKVRSNQVFHIQIYCLEEGTIEQEFTVEGEFLRADEIVQNQCGSIFCLPYYDNGFFKILTFSLKDKQLDLFHDINSQIGIDLKSQPPLNFNFPLIYCMFLDETTLFVNLYDSLEKNHWYFRYNYVKQDFVRGEAKFIKLKQPVNLDFPIGHFYDNQKDEIYCIYRHGTCVTIKYAVKEKSDEEQDMYHLIKKISAEQKEIKEELKNLKDQIGGKKAVS